MGKIKRTGLSPHLRRLLTEVRKLPFNKHGKLPYGQNGLVATRLGCGPDVLRQMIRLQVLPHEELDSLVEANMLMRQLLDYVDLLPVNRKKFREWLFSESGGRTPEEIDNKLLALIS